MNKLVNSMRTLARQRIIVYTLLGGRKKNNWSERVIFINDLWLIAENFPAVRHWYKACETHILELQSE